jgi:membrane protease subunit HflK
MLWRFLAVAVVVGYLATGIYGVGSDQSGVAIVLGRAVVRDVPPGIHWNPPWPVGRVIVAQTATSFTMPIGYRMLEKPSESPISDLWLTGDTNVVTVRLNVQYSIKSLADFALNHENPRELLRRAGERVATRFLVTEQVDAALTNRRQELPRAVREGVQALLDAEGVGIDVQSVTLQELAPPVAGGVRNAFQEVQNASADRERTIYEAGAYRAQVLAEAGGNAEKIVSDATADKQRRIEIAGGETERFLSLAREHDRAPSVTETRLYLEAIDRLLPLMNTYVIEPGEGGHVNLKLLP